MYQTLFKSESSSCIDLTIIIPFKINDINEIVDTLNNVCLLKNTQIILVNDGSNQNVVDQVFKYIKNHTNFNFYSSLNNHGVSAARNYGLSVCETPFVSFVDSDDLINCDVVSNSIHLIKQYNEVVFVGLKMKYLPSNQLIYDTESKTEFNILNSKNVYTNYLYFSTDYDAYSLKSACSKIFRRKLINDCFFDDKLKNFEDSDFMLKVCSKQFDCILFNQTMYFYIMNNNSASHSYKENLDRQFEYYFNKNLSLNFKSTICDCLQFFLIDSIFNRCKNNEKLTFKMVKNQCKQSYVKTAIKNSKLLEISLIQNKFVRRIVCLAKLKLNFLVYLFIFNFCKKYQDNIL